MTRMALVPSCFFLLTAFLAPSVPARAAEKAVIGITPSLTASLEVIAAEEGFFAREGLDVDLREFSRGGKVMDALFAGELDVGSQAGFSLVTQTFKRRDFRIISTIAAVGNDNQVVARRDRGIRELGDLRGKRVGTMKGMVRYALDLLLLQSSLSMRDVTLVMEDDPEPLLKRLASGDVDAISIFGAWVDKARRELGENAVVFRDDSLMRITTFMTAMAPRIREKPELYARLVRAYLRTEEFVHAQPERALQIVCRRFKMDLEATRKLWRPNLFHLALEQSIMVDLENMARWQLDNDLKGAAQLPNYLEFISFDTLERVVPQRVTIVH